MGLPLAQRLYRLKKKMQTTKMEMIEITITEFSLK